MGDNLTCRRSGKVEDLRVGGGRKNLFGNLLGEGILNFSPFIWILMLNYHSGGESAGKFIALSSLYAFGKAFIEFGMNNEAVAEYAAGDARVIAEIIAARFILLLMLASFGCIYSLLFGLDYYLFLAIIPLVFSPICMDWFFKASQNSLKNAQLAALSFVVSMLPLAFWGISLDVILISKALWFSIYATGLYAIFYGGVKKTNERVFVFLVFLRSGWARIIRSWSYALSSFMVVGSQNLPILLASLWMTPLMAGYFSLFAKIYSVFLVFKYVLMISFLPRVSSAFRTSVSKARGLISKATVNVGLMVFLALVMAYFSKYYLVLAIGFESSEYQQVSRIVDSFIIAAFVSCLYTFLPMILIVQERRFLFMLSVACGLVMVTVLMTALYLFDVLTPVSAATSIAVSEFCVLIILIFFLRDFIRGRDAERNLV